MRGAILADFVTCPGRILFAGERGGFAFHVDHRQLPALLRPGARLRIGVVVPNFFHHVGRSHALLQERQRLRAVTNIGHRLRGHGADIRLRRNHPVADAEHARLHRAANFARVGVVTQNGKRGDFLPGRFVFWRFLSDGK